MKEESIFPTGIAVGGGLTKREYCAVKLLQGMLASTMDMHDLENDEAREFRKKMVKIALGYADAMLEALDKPSKE